MFDGLFAHFLENNQVFFTCVLLDHSLKNNQAFITCVLFDHMLIHSTYLTFYVNDFAFMTLLSDFDANLCSLYWVHVGLVILFFLSW